jgi:hypothetical protein
MEVALIFAAFALVIAYAMFEAWQDFERIQVHERIDHIEGWVIRAIITIFIWGVASFKIGYSAIPCAIGSAFLFSAVFRYSLNRMRGKDWRYVSLSSWYDSFFIGMNLRNMIVFNDWIIDQNEEWYKKTDFYAEHQAEVHRAGTIAYITEVVILAVCIFIAA